MSELELKGDPGLWPELPTIGTAIDNVKLLVLDEKMKPVHKALKASCTSVVLVWPKVIPVGMISPPNDS